MGIELTVILLNMIVLVFAYGLLNPVFSGSNLAKVSFQDLMALSISLLITGTSLPAKTVGFSIILFDVNWFCFTVLSFMALKIPLFVWYAKHWKMASSQ